MKPRTQSTLAEIQRRARQRVGDVGIWFSKSIRPLVDHDVRSVQAAVKPSVVFDLGASSGSDIATNKRAMIAEAFGSAHKEVRHH